MQNDDSKEIEKLRSEIRQITLEIIRLSASRTDIAKKIGQFKQEHDLIIQTPEVERELRLSVLEEASRRGLNQLFCLRLLNLLVSDSTKVQKAESEENRSSHLSVFTTAKRMEARGDEIIHLEVGEPDLPPPQPVLEELSRAVGSGLTRYTETRGVHELIDAITSQISRKHKVSITEEQVIVTPGGRFAIYGAIVTMIKPGDEVIIVEPAWPAYRDCVELVGGKISPIITSVEDGWEMSAEAVLNSITKATKMIIINQPSNPNGKIPSKDFLDQIAKVAQEEKITILSDEVYNQYAYKPFTSILEFTDTPYILINSFSKSYSMTGYRIGYAVSDTETVRKISALQSVALTSVPEFVQYAAIKALDQDSFVKDARKEMEKRRALVCEELRRLPVTFKEPDGGFYVFPRIDKERDIERLLMRILEEKKVALAPGSAFGPFEDYFRLAFCQPEELLKEAIQRIGWLL
ncbi:MAG: aminotransferase class I/II-fold pyridoxal phosphate-dependent enzyme [Nitrososphaerales archaeon]